MLNLHVLGVPWCLVCIMKQVFQVQVVYLPSKHCAHTLGSLSHTAGEAYLSLHYSFFSLSFPASLKFYFCSTNPANSSIVMKHLGHDKALQKSKQMHQWLCYYCNMSLRVCFIERPPPPLFVSPAILLCREGLLGAKARTMQPSDFGTEAVIEKPVCGEK